MNVQPLGAFIHAEGVEPALLWFMATLETLLGDVGWSTSRVDVFADVKAGASRVRIGRGSYAALGRRR